MNRRIAALIAVVVLFGACSAPYGDRPCITRGFVRDPAFGPGCTLPRVGAEPKEPGSWRNESGVDLGGMHVAMRSDSLLFFLDTYGPPVKDETVVYGIAFRFTGLMADDPRNSLVFVLASGDTAWMQFNAVGATGIPIWLAYADAGLQLEVPINVLPYDGEAIVSDVELHWVNGAWEQSGGYIGNAICWDASNPDNQCASPL